MDTESLIFNGMSPDMLPNPDPHILIVNDTGTVDTFRVSDPGTADPLPTDYTWTLNTAAIREEIEQEEGKRHKKKFYKNYGKKRNRFR